MCYTCQNVSFIYFRLEVEKQGFIIENPQEKEKYFPKIFG